jgi:hypothetical protein
MAGRKPPAAARRLAEDRQEGHWCRLSDERRGRGRGSLLGLDLRSPQAVRRDLLPAAVHTSPSAQQLVSPDGRGSHAAPGLGRGGRRQGRRPLGPGVAELITAHRHAYARQEIVPGWVCCASGRTATLGRSIHRGPQVAAQQSRAGMGRHGPRGPLAPHRRRLASACRGVLGRAERPSLTGGGRPGPRGRRRPASPMGASRTSLRRLKARRWPGPGRRAPGASGCGGAPSSRGRGGWDW